MISEKTIEQPIEADVRDHDPEVEQKNVARELQNVGEVDLALTHEDEIDREVLTTIDIGRPREVARLTVPEVGYKEIAGDL